MKRFLGVWLAAALLGMGVAAGEDTLDISGELNRAREQLKSLLQHYTEAHPLVQQQRNKIAALERNERSLPPAPVLAQQLDAARQELQQLRQKYTDKHPAVVFQRKKVAELERRQQHLAPESKREPLDGRSPLIHPTLPPRPAE